LCSTIDDLRQEFEELVAGGAIAGTNRLYNLAARANNVAKVVSGSERVVAFVLSAVFNSLAVKMNGQPVTVHAGQELYQRLHGPIDRAIELLAVGVPNGDAMSAASAVVDALYAAVQK